MRTLSLTVLALAAVTACSPRTEKKTSAPDPVELARRAAQFERLRTAPDSARDAEGAIARWLLPDKLKEISGLTLTADGRLLGHGDERGHVFEIDYHRGVVVKEFTLVEGGQTVKSDFEGITTANGSVFLLASNSKLYEFKEGADGAKVDFTIHDTGLEKECEFEGVAYDKATNSLLMACKNVHDKKLKGSLVLFRWKLSGDSASRVSQMVVPLALVIGENDWAGVHPSDITIDPFNGNYVIIASRERALIEITPAGALVFSKPIPGEHDQPEGIAITKDSLLIISDEAGNPKTNPELHPHRTLDDSVHRPAVVTVYRWP